MSQQDVLKLYRDAKENPELKRKLNTAPNAEAFVEMAKEYGYNFTVTEWQSSTGFQVEELEAELSEIPGI